MQVLLFFFNFILLTTLAQDFPLRKIREEILSTLPESISVDRLGNLYTFGEGRLVKLSTEGLLIAERKINNSNEVKLIEAWNPLRIWIYFRNSAEQKVQFLDQKLLNAEEPITIDPSFAIEPLLIAPGINNHTYWILDSDYSLKLINTQINTVERETKPINQNSANSFKFMRVYQGFIFLLTENNQIIMINSLGNTVKFFNKNVKHIGVLGEDIYFHEGQTLYFENIYNNTGYQITLPHPVDFVAATDERLLLIKDKKLEVFEFKPKN